MINYKKSLRIWSKELRKDWDRRSNIQFGRGSGKYSNYFTDFGQDFKFSESYYVTSMLLGVILIRRKLSI